VKTTRFAWKLSNSVMGTPEVQVAESEEQLRRLFDAIGSDPPRQALLTEFLRRLDAAGVQAVLVSRTAGP
jgi:hypothetical protein